MWLQVCGRENHSRSQSVFPSIVNKMLSGACCMNQSTSIFAVAAMDGVEDVTKDSFFPFHILVKAMPKHCIHKKPDLLIFLLWVLNGRRLLPGNISTSQNFS